jgi:hypothetical protein
MSKPLHFCPDCNNELVRIKRTDTERFLNKITFQKFYNRKFFCYSCLKNFTFSKSKNLNGISEEVFVYSNNHVFMKAGLPATLILLAIVIAMVMSSNLFNGDSFSANLSSYFAR